MSWTLEDSEHARLRSGESLQVHSHDPYTSTAACIVMAGQVMREPVVYLAVCFAIFVMVGQVMHEPIVYLAVCFAV